LKIYTIGHSTRRIEDFIHILRAHGVERIIDVRTIPRSRMNPQFNRENLPQVFPYEHMPGLGGLRHPSKDSINTGWRNASFRGYADYMMTEEFARNLDQLIEFAGREQVCIMCAESVPWRCHRSLIADALTVRGISVEHIMSATHANPHKMTPFARVDGISISYPAELAAQLQLATPQLPSLTDATHHSRP
jgi:uncharacterized protein (DUF488 family)